MAVGVGMRPALWAAFGGPGADVTSFIFTVKTDNTGTSEDDEFTIPLHSGETYDFTATYDGQETAHSTDSDLTLTFPSGAGTYEVEISGTFAGVNFDNGGDVLKLTNIASFGDVGWCKMEDAFYGSVNCAALPGAIPANANITTLLQTFRSCSIATEFPAVSALTNVTSLSSAWRSCTDAPAFPEVSALTGVTTIAQAWQSCTTCEVFPDVSALVNCDSFSSSWRNNVSITTVPALPTASTALTTVANAFLGVGSGMTGTVVELWDTELFPNISSFAGCFTGATGLTNYADIPDAWKGL